MDNNKTKVLMNDIIKALSSLQGWGSVEIYMQDGEVTQITSRKIQKTKHQLGELVL